MLVPVERPQIGVSPQLLATTRWVPSPPSTTIASTPRSSMVSTALVVSCALLVSGIGALMIGRPLLSSAFDIVY